MAGAQPFADHKAKIEPHRRIALFDRLFDPIGSLVDFAADEMEKRMGAGVAARFTVTHLLCDGSWPLFFSVAPQECGEQADSIGEPAADRIGLPRDLQSLCKITLVGM